MGNGAKWAAWFMAVSTAFVFYGRYAIHETILITSFLLFTFGYYVFRQEDRTKGFVLIVTSLFMAFMIKETFFIFYVTFAIALSISNYLPRVLKAIGFEGESENQKNNSLVIKSFNKNIAVLCVVINVIITMAIYSGFGRNPSGLLDMFASFKPWASTGMESGHDKVLNLLV